MSFVHLEFTHFYRTAYAHTLSAEDYRYNLDSHGFGIYGVSSPLGGVIEIGTVEKNPLVLSDLDTGEEHVAGEMDIFIIPPNHRFDIHTLQSGEHKHTSAEFLIDCRTERIFQSTLSREQFNAVKDQSLILPYVIPASRENEELINLLRKIARDRMLLMDKNYFEECAEFMRILVEVNAGVRRANSPDTLSPAHRRYCQKAKEYISGHLSGRIALDEIAEYVGLNKNYLTNVFTSCEGMPISEYINRLKLNRMIEMVIKYDYSIKKGGAYVGYTDVNYISRIFKKYYGITISEYKRMHHK